MNGPLRPCGTYATWQGRERRVTGRADLDEMHLLSESDLLRREASVPVADLGTIRKVVTTAQWRGGEIIVADFHGVDSVGFYCNDSALARREELYGDQYSGWTGVASVADLSDVRERVTVLREA